MGRRRSVQPARGLAALLGLALVASGAAARAGVPVVVDAAQDRHPISPRIYGLNFASDTQLTEGRITVSRWGGNATSRYNYQVDVTNTGLDYYFENIAGCFNAAANWCSQPPADPKETSGANAFLSATKAGGTVALFTIPTIGWVAKSPPKYGHPFDCGCPKSVNAWQDDYDPYDTNCGSGRVGGQLTDCGAQSKTSVPVDPEWAKAWVSYLVAKLGPSNGQRVYALDNEPALWSSTHHDVHPARLGYDELWQRMRDYAVAILEADPTAEIAGPAEWGWPNYFCSDADVVSNGCSPSSPDRAAHGGVELTAWLLDRAKEYEAANGKRILHYLDLHYYPQGGSGPEITRSLWDPSYVDPSWINDTIRLLPRMRDWVSQHYPGTKTSLSEFDFYDHGSPAGAVLYAEVLGLFAREGLDMATAWSPPAPDEAAFAAYRLYRNFDGNGGAFEPTAVRATVGGAGVEAYAASGPSRLTVALVNETGGSVDVDVTIGGFDPTGTAALFGNAGGATISKLGDVALSGGVVTVTLASTSIAMLVIEGTDPNAVPGTTSSAATGAGGGGGGATTAGSGTSASGSAGAGGAGAGGAGAAGAIPSDGGGCGCRLASGEERTGAWALAAAALALGLGRRARRASGLRGHRDRRVHRA